MVTRIDLLVHTTAPSSRKDDERYKAQAEAYKSFVGAGTSTRIVSHGSTNATGGLPLSPPNDMIGTDMIVKMRQTSQQQDDELSNLVWDPTTFLEETQLGYTALESQIFASSSRTPKKPLKRAHPVEQQIIEKRIIEEQNIDEHVTEDRTTVIERTEHHAPRHDESSSSHRIPSQSSYLMSPVLDRSSKKPRINEANRQYFQSSRVLFPPSEPVQEGGGLVVASTAPLPTLGQTALDSQQHSFPGDDVTSELPSSYSLSPESYRKRQQSIQRSISDPGPSVIGPTESGPDLGEQRLSEVPQEPPVRHASQKGAEANCPEKEVRQSQPKYPDSETAVKDFATVLKDNERIKDTPVEIIDPPIPPTDLGLPTTIRAPAPQPSLQPFKTHITESLKYLSETASLAQSYKPIFISRDLEQSERGCWTFDMTPWPAQLRSEFFQFLAKMIETGRVGWGVWCVREPASSLTARVFCWGEVVRHVYLMLYVASKSKVRKLGLRWVDAGGEVVVQMRGE
jgi:hypothetical protein